MPTNFVRRGTILLALVVCFACLSSAFTVESTASDITVNTTSDAVDFSGAQQVSDLPGLDGLVSLREAIISANNTLGPQAIGFNIPTSDSGFDGTVFTIRPLSQIPPLSDDFTTIDGSTQVTFTGNTNAAGPEIVLNGSLISPGADGLPIHSANNVIHSLVINGFANNPGVCCGIGIDITGSQANGNVVTGCFLGLDASGTVAVGNGDDGLTISREAANNRIGGASSEERNVISGNSVRGISLFSDYNSVVGNFIGTDVTGTLAIGNGEQDGIGVSGSNNIIRSNIISGNRSGVGLSEVSNGNIVMENFLGTDVTGTIALANASLGAFVQGVNNIVVGNLISGNALDGVGLFSALNNAVQGNRIGTDVNGNPSLGNGRFGVHISNCCGGGPANGNRIESNIIAGNGSVGVAIFDGVRNSISRNRIFSNGDLGIRLDPGLVPNDPGDFDTGPNELMNYPVLEEAKATPGRLIVKGAIDTQNVRDVVIEFFANPVPTPGGDPSGHGEGAIFLGTARPNPHGRFTAALPTVPIGTIISATATDRTGNTSEFGANIVASFP
jgi:parallel beta-helix repeat protein